MAMHLKSYFADTVDEALALAATELGGEAMLVYARPAEGESRRLGRQEVVCSAPALAPPPRRASGPASPPRTVSPLSPASGLGPVSRLGQLNPPGPVSPLGEVRAGIAQVIRDLDRPSAFEAAQPASRAAMIRSLRTDASLRRHPGGRSAVIFAGPPGAGKTLTTVKLAARELMRGAPAPLIVSLDTRVGGAEPLRAYAEALGCPFEHAWSANEAAALFESRTAHELALIDTPGVTPAEPDLEDDLERLRERIPLADLHLTLSAAAKDADLTRMVERFQRFRPTKLLFTRLDETGTYGPLWSEPVRWKIPVSFLSTGQQVPGDIEPATAVRVVDLALNGRGGWLDARRAKTRAATA